jgi:membrane-bound lytic murein transglycosylase A
VPLLARPDDLVDVDDHNRPAGLDPSYAFARRTATGLVPYFDRAEIETGALAGRGLERVFVEDPVDAFFVHVQGSVRIRLEEGGVMRLAYAAKAGHPYTSIAKVLIARGEATAETMTADVLRDWLKAHPDEAPALMRTNRSYVFFAEQPDLDPELGAVAAANVQLTPGVSLAVDRTLHTFGTPIFIDADLPLGPDGAVTSVRRLMVAQDTGSAIVGAARGDVFVGLGPEAGRRAGLVRHEPRGFVVLVPRGGEAER